MRKNTFLFWITSSHEHGMCWELKHQLASSKCWNLFLIFSLVSNGMCTGLIDLLLLTSTEYFSVNYKSPGFLSAQILTIYSSLHMLSSCCIYINKNKARVLRQEKDSSWFPEALEDSLWDHESMLGADRDPPAT